MRLRALRAGRAEPVLRSHAKCALGGRTKTVWRQGTRSQQLHRPILTPVSVSTPVRGSGTPVKAMFLPESQSCFDWGGNMASMLLGFHYPLLGWKQKRGPSLGCQKVSQTSKANGQIKVQTANRESLEK